MQLVQTVASTFDCVTVAVDISKNLSYTMQSHVITNYRYGPVNNSLNLDFHYH